MSHCDLLLDALRDGQWKSHTFLYRELNIMVHSRASDLRKRGHVIETRRDGKTQTTYYRLVALRGTAPVSPHAPGAVSRSASQPCPPFPLGEEGLSAGARSPFGGSEPQATIAPSPVVSPPGSEAGSESPNTLFDVDERKAPAWA